MNTKNYLKLDGVKGESRNSKHFGEIDVIAFSFGFQHSGKLDAFGVEQNGGTVTGFADFQISKKMDSNSHLLMKLLLSEKKFEKGVLTTELSSEEGKVSKSIVFNFKKLQIISISSYGNDLDGTPQENVGFTCDDVRIQHIYR